MTADTRRSLPDSVSDRKEVVLDPDLGADLELVATSKGIGLGQHANDMRLWSMILSTGPTKLTASGSRVVVEEAEQRVKLNLVGVEPASVGSARVALLQTGVSRVSIAALSLVSESKKEDQMEDRMEVDKGRSTPVAGKKFCRALSIFSHAVPTPHATRNSVKSRVYFSSKIIWSSWSRAIRRY